MNFVSFNFFVLIFVYIVDVVVLMRWLGILEGLFMWVWFNDIGIEIVFEFGYEVTFEEKFRN